ncbi:MarC family protein [Trebonia sp.]|uniref:MarC family protein n=1 Tax=Trebonia sp. TaxID=2767075 RepID=UPI00262AA248|nr:MarC family protein [Trebonia sp.]
MGSINFADVFATFLALLGPQKILLSFEAATRRLSSREIRFLAATSSIAAAAVGVACALTAPWLTTFFHISYQAVELAGGSIFFIYAVTLVFGVRLFDEGGGEQPDGTPAHPVSTGFRALVLPYVVTPLGVSAVLVESLSGAGWGWRSVVAASYVAVAAIDLVCFLLLGPLVRRMHAVVREVLSRLLGLLLAGVGVNLFLQGLTGLGLLPHYSSGGH